MAQEEKIPEKTPVTPWQQRKVLQIVVVIVGIVVILAVAVLMFAGGPSSGGSLSENKSTVTHPVSTVTTATHAPATLLPVATTAKKPVDFLLETGDMTNCGLTCRQLNASITNTGYSTAHEVCISLQMHNSKGAVIGLNGADTMQQCIGDLGSGQVKTETVTINADCGVFATKCIQEILTLETRVTSKETTVRMADTVIKV